MREALGIETVYFFQNEDTDHHFHQWMFPRYDWMLSKFGKKVESVRPIMRYTQEQMKTPENILVVESAVENMRGWMSK